MNMLTPISATRGTAARSEEDRTPVPPDIAFLQWLIDECGYRHPKPLPNGRWAAIHRKMFTHAILTGRIHCYIGIDEHWCFALEAEAIIALDAWDGTGEPTGWIRHPASGRRVSRGENEMDENGRIVPIGEMYVRS